ncbi:MAG TPA: TonB-dependent receptor [Micropepsaceae bacterium]|nr:TonB-dependent receptor [Micropepsaceae bacterium]
MATSILERKLKSALMAGAGAAALFAVAPFAYAQDAPAEEAAPTEEASAEGTADEVVYVTGSRIPNNTSTTATVSVDSLRVELTGEANSADVLRELPQINAVTSLTGTNSNFFTASNGINTVNLRNLGDDRTLVLVNGRRFVSGNAGSQAVDFNMIPTALIKRIDVVTGGASAVYGSDALAGVVNVILNDSFEGAVFTVQGGQSEVYDTMNTLRATATFGSNFADDRGNAVVNVGWDTSGPAYARSRPETALDCIAVSVFPNQQACPFFSSYAEGARFRFSTAAGAASTSRALNPDLTTITPFSTPVHGFNRQGQRLNLIPIDRYNFSSFANYELFPGHTLFFEGTYGRTTTNSDIEPFPLDSDDVYGETEQVGSIFNRRAGIAPDNPYIPRSMLDLLGTRYGIVNPNLLTRADLVNQLMAIPDAAIGFARRMTELGNRGQEADRHTARFVIGMEGEIANGWAYEVSYNRGYTKDDQIGGGQVNVLNLRQSLDAVDLGGGNIVCRDLVAQLQGCTPINFFASPTGAAATWTQAEINWLLARPFRSVVIEQEIASASVTGSLFEIPGGDVQVAFGLEYRSESSSENWDALSNAGQNGSNVSPNTSGEFDVYEVFGEVQIPLLTDVEFAKELTVNLSGRYSEYSSIGQTWAWAASGAWQPVDDIRFRGQLARAVRAPNIGELFTGPSETFGVVNDPCDGLNAGLPTSPTDPTVIANCLLNPAIAARAALPGGFVLTQAEKQGTGGFQQGNPNLIQETGDTVTFGFVFTPTFMDWIGRLSVSVDYFDIEIEDAIAAVGRQTTLDICYASAGLSSPLCGNLVRDVNGALVEVNTGQANSRTLETSGIDVQLNWGQDLNEWFNEDGELGDLGSLNLTVNYTWTEKYTTTVFPGTPFEAVTESMGTLGAFRHRANAGLVYRLDNWLFSFDAEFVSEANDYGNGWIPNQWFFDAGVRYEFLEGVTAIFGVRNLTDEFVFIPQGLPEIPTGWATEPTVYDGLGRRYFAGIRWEL